MLQGGTVVIFVSEMERSVQFYRDILGLNLIYRAGDEWASFDAGDGLLLGLHPKSENNPKPGTHGSIALGFKVTHPIQTVVDELTERGVEFRGPVIDEGIRIAFFADPDDNDLHIFEVPGS